MLKYANRKAVPKFTAIASTLTFILAACQTPVSSAPEVTPSAGPALWTVQDEDTTIHLFGYAPVLKPDTDWQSETFTNAFNAAELIMLEADNTDPAAQAEMQGLIPKLGVYSDGRTLSDVLSEAQREELSPITQSYGAPLQALNALKPWLASVQLGVMGVSKNGYDVANPPAMIIATTAKTDGKRIETLESPTYLLKRMAEFTEAQQIELLMHAARNLKDDPDQQARLAEAWLAGDVDTIGTLLHGQDGAWANETSYQVMLVDRNEAWTQEILSLLESETDTVFVAVGLGHLAGKDSLIGMIEGHGHKVVRQ